RLDEAKAAYGQALDRDRDDVEAHYGLALSLQDQGSLDEALDHLDRVVALAADSPIGWNTRGDVRASRRDFETALADFRRTTELAPDASLGPRRQGDMLRALGRLDEAKAAYGQALDRDRDDVEAHYGLALTLQDQGKLDEALGHIDRVIALAADSPVGWGTRGDVRASRGDFEAALADFRRTTELAPDASLGPRRQGDMLRALGRLDEAKAAYGQALDRDRDDVEANFGLALTLQDQGKLDEALGHIDRVIALAADSPAGWGTRGDVRATQGDFEAALADFRRATEIAPDDPLAHRRQGDMLKALGRLDEAKTAYGEALKRAPDDAEAHYGLALTLQEHGNLDEALGHFDRVVALVADSPVGWSARGEARADREDFAGALDDFQRATKIAPADALAHRRQGDMLKALGRPDEAKAAYDQALERDPDDVEAHYGLALTLRDQGSLDEALGHLDRVVALAADSPVAWSTRSDVLVSLCAYDRAIDDINHALKLTTTDVDLWIQLGDTHRLWADDLRAPEQRDAAVVAIKEALRREPSNAVAIAISGALKSSSGQVEEALRDFDTSLKQDPKYSWAIKEKGKVLLRAGRLDDALGVFGKLQEASNESKLDAIAGRVLCLRGLGRSAEAERELSGLDSGSHDDAKTFVTIARAFEDYEAHQDAIRMYRRAIARSPASADAHNGIAWCRADHLGTELEESTAHAMLAVNLSSDKAAKGNCFDTLGWVWFKRGALSNAKRFLDEAVKLREPDMLVREHLAIVVKATTDRPAART
ncbi:MAG TPA: tetratricopeptide repeat protein, partial [Dongiaceae bacterium]|nr:tetratricopeptide repeat protein [Dongiaceae bacterium]